MKYFLFVIISISILASCKMRRITGSGNIITKTRQLNSFTSISARGGITVDIQYGPQTSVVVEADDNLEPYIETKVVGGKLSIAIEKYTSFRNTTMLVHITMPYVEGINSSASASVTTKTIMKGNNEVDLKASSGSKITVNLDAPIIKADASSGAEINTAGFTKNAITSASSGSNINFADLKAETASANVSSGATINIFASIKVNATASSGGNISYRGGAKEIVKNESSGGSVNEE